MLRSSKIIFSFFLYLLIFCNTVSYSQGSDTLSKRPKRPKVGVVLSGGGAKGLAHIGVLKALEEEGVKVDFIGGTSMGAMVGALYASGYTAGQLDSIFKVTDFDAIVQDNFPRKVKSFYERESDERYSISFPFKKMRLGLPIALSKGQNTYNLFNRLLYHVRYVDDFNKLPIPFLCIATDIETGEEVLLNKGNLVSAVAASGSFPGLFYPIEIDGRYLTDGGIVNNYPVEEIRRLGADIVIGVDVQSGFMKRKELTSAAKVMMQIINFQMLKTMDKKREETDIYIKPDIKGFNVVSFAEGNKIVSNGELAASEYRESFRKIARLQGNIAHREKLVPDSMMRRISSIEIKGNEHYSRAYILGKLRMKEGDRMNFTKFNEGFNQLSSTQNFRSITYKFSPKNDGDEMMVSLKESDIKTLVRFGLHYDKLYKSGVLLNFTHKNLITQNDVISADLVFGDNVRYQLDYYLDNGFYWSFGLRSRFNQFQTIMPANLSKFIPNYQENRKIDVTYYDLTHQAYFQTLFKQVFSVGAGLEYKYIDIDSETLVIDGYSFKDIYTGSDFFSMYGYLILDAYDKKYFPKNGVFFDGTFKTIFSSKGLGKNLGRYSITQGSIGIAKTFLDKFTLRLDNEMGLTIGESDGVLDFLLGGYGYVPTSNFRPFYGYDFLNLMGDSYIRGAVGFDVEFYKKNHLNFWANYANIGEDIFDKTAGWFSKPTYSGYAFGYGLESIIGPIEIKYSWSPEVRSSYWWVSLGFWF